MPESWVIDRRGYKLYCWSKEFVLTYCQSFLLIFYSLHNPPRPSRHSSWQADEITVGKRQQRQRVTWILNIYSFCLSCWTFTVCQSWGEQKPLRFVFFPTCFCLVTRSQSSTSQGLSSSGIFTFTSTRLANISSWTNRITEQLKKRENGIISVHPAGLHRSNMFERITIIITNLSALVAHMNWKQEPGRRMVSPERRKIKGTSHKSMQLLALPLDGEPKSGRHALTSGYGLSWYFCMFYSCYILIKLQRCWSLMVEITSVCIHRWSRLFTTHTLSTVGSTRALFFLGPCGVSPLLVPSPGPGAREHINWGLENRSASHSTINSWTVWSCF